jgi:hypothetical protein
MQLDPSDGEIGFSRSVGCTAGDAFSFGPFMARQHNNCAGTRLFLIGEVEVWLYIKVPVLGQSGFH